MAIKLGKVVTYQEELPHVFVKSRDILDALYLHLRYANDHQSWQGCDPP